MPDLSLIIINWNTRQLLLDCIASIYRTVRQGTFELFVVDNGSTDGSVEAVSQHYPAVTVVANRRNEGFARANNRALRRMQGRYAVLLNSDTVLKEGALERLVAFMDANPKAGMCGPRLLNANGSRQTSFGVFPDLLSEFGSKSLIRLFCPAVYARVSRPDKTVFSGPAVVDFIIGACMVVRKEAMDEAGMLDEDYFFFYEEIDWCRRMHKTGRPVYHVPEAEVYHLAGGSTKKVGLRARAESWRSRYLYFQKSLGLAAFGKAALFMLGLTQVMYRFAGYTVLNVLSLFSLGRLRRRWALFAYLLLWHLRGLPVSLCLPRS